MDVSLIFFLDDEFVGISIPLGAIVLVSRDTAGTAFGLSLDVGFVIIVIGGSEL